MITGHHCTRQAWPALLGSCINASSILHFVCAATYSLRVACLADRRKCTVVDDDDRHPPRPAPAETTIIGRQDETTDLLSSLSDRSCCCCWPSMHLLLLACCSKQLVPLEDAYAAALSLLVLAVFSPVAGVRAGGGVRVQMQCSAVQCGYHKAGLHTKWNTARKPFFSNLHNDITSTTTQLINSIIT